MLRNVERKKIFDFTTRKRDGLFIEGSDWTRSKNEMFLKHFVFKYRTRNINCNNMYLYIINLGSHITQ